LTRYAEGEEGEEEEKEAEEGPQEEQDDTNASAEKLPGDSPLVFDVEEVAEPVELTDDEDCLRRLTEEHMDIKGAASMWEVLDAVLVPPAG
jgi:hypothetical protein